MPIYEFECPIHGVFEYILPLSKLDEINKGCACPEVVLNSEFGRCGELSERIWSIPIVRFEGKPTIIFRNAQNPTQVQVATHENDTPPEGYIEEELRGPIERTKFENEQNKIKDVENQMITESIRLRKDQERKARHADQDATMSNHDTGTQELLKFVRERNRKKEPPAKKSQVRLDINHLDSSNLTPS